MNKHTPGPWQVEIGNQEHGTIKSKEYTIAKVDCRYGQIGEPEANARLIAAAPEMLEALERVMQLQISTEGDEIFEEVRAAIAKATGK